MRIITTIEKDKNPKKLYQGADVILVVAGETAFPFENHVIGFPCDYAQHGEWKKEEIPIFKLRADNLGRYKILTEECLFYTNREDFKNLLKEKKFKDPNQSKYFFRVPVSYLELEKLLISP